MARDFLPGKIMGVNVPVQEVVLFPGVRTLSLIIETTRSNLIISNVKKSSEKYIKLVIHACRCIVHRYHSSKCNNIGIVSDIPIELLSPQWLIVVFSKCLPFICMINIEYEGGYYIGVWNPPYDWADTRFNLSNQIIGKISYLFCITHSHRYISVIRVSIQINQRYKYIYMHI